jgi:hypothetical protein
MQLERGLRQSRSHGGNANLEGDFWVSESDSRREGFLVFCDRKDFQSLETLVSL